MPHHPRPWPEDFEVPEIDPGDFGDPTAAKEIEPGVPPDWCPVPPEDLAVVDGGCTELPWPRPVGSGQGIILATVIFEIATDVPWDEDYEVPEEVITREYGDAA